MGKEESLNAIEQFEYIINNLPNETNLRNIKVFDESLANFSRTYRFVKTLSAEQTLRFIGSAHATD